LWVIFLSAGGLLVQDNFGVAMELEPKVANGLVALAL
jgi:hypothetical protein